MAGARALWCSTEHEDRGLPQARRRHRHSFTQFVPGHVHLHPIGQRVKDAAGGYGAEFNTIAVDDGIAMGHDGMPTPSVILVAAVLTEQMLTMGQ